MEEGAKRYTGPLHPVMQHASGKWFYAYVNPAGEIVPYKGRLRDTYEEAAADGGECGAEFHNDKKAKQRDRILNR